MRKASFPLLNKREKKFNYSEPFKRDKRATSLALLIIILYPPIFIISNYYPRITPSTPEEGIRKHTLFAKFYDQVKVVYDHRIHSQVVRNRGHGFSKRFNPAGVHNFTHMYQPTINAKLLALFLGKPAEGG